MGELRSISSRTAASSTTSSDSATGAGERCNCTRPKIMLTRREWASSRTWSRACPDNWRATAAKVPGSSGFNRPRPRANVTTVPPKARINST